MARSELRMPSPNGVASGQTATFKLPIGNRFHNLQLIYSGVTLAQMTEIRVYANGKVIHRLSGEERAKLNLFDGRTPTAGVLIIPFDRYNLRTLLGEEDTALNTGSFDENGRGISSLYIEIDIDAGATAPEFKLHATVSAKKAGGAGRVLHTLKHVRDPAGAGEFDISDLPRGTATTQLLNRIVFAKNAGLGNVSAVKVERDQVTLFERSAELNTAVQKMGVRDPQTGWFVIDRTENGAGGDPIVLAGASDYRYKLDMSDGATLGIITETIGSIGD